MDDILNQIEKYLSNKLTATEKEAFENKIKTDEKLAAEVDLFRDMMGGLRLRNNKGLKNRLNEIHEQEIGKTSTAKIRPLRWKPLVAAAAVLLLLLTAYFFLRQDNSNPASIYASNFTPFEPDWTSRGGSQPILSLQQVKQLYDTKQYKNLLLLINESNLQKGADSVKITMIKGIAQLEMNQYSEARESFENVAKNAVLRAEAQWYIALSFLKENDIAKCKEALTPFVANPSSDYHREAQEILEDLGIRN